MVIYWIVFINGNFPWSLVLLKRGWVLVKNWELRCLNFLSTGGTTYQFIRLLPHSLSYDDSSCLTLGDCCIALEVLAGLWFFKFEGYNCLHNLRQVALEILLVLPLVEVHRQAPPPAAPFALLLPSSHWGRSMIMKASWWMTSLPCWLKRMLIAFMITIKSLRRLFVFMLPLRMFIWSNSCRRCNHHLRRTTEGRSSIFDGFILCWSLSFPQAGNRPTSSQQLEDFGSFLLPLV